MQYVENGDSRSTCAVCGYDLTGRRDAVRCPECGGRVWLGELLQDDARMTRREARALGRESFYRTYRRNAFGLLILMGLGLVAMIATPIIVPGVAEMPREPGKAMAISTMYAGAILWAAVFAFLWLISRARLEHVATIRRLRAAEAQLDRMNRAGAARPAEGAAP